MDNIFDRLKGGDLRSIGDANEVVKDIKTQKDFDKLFQGLFHSDRKVVMRAADALEKITLAETDFLNNHKTELIELCFSAGHIELKWHLALLVSRLKLTPGEFRNVWQLLTEWATDKRESKIVRVNSIQGLFNLLQENKESEQDFNLAINEIMNENIPSLNARIKKIRNGNR